MANSGGLGALASLMDYSDDENSSQASEVVNQEHQPTMDEKERPAAFVVDRFLTPEDMIQSLLSEIVLDGVMERASSLDVKFPPSAPLPASFSNAYRGSTTRGRGHSEDSDSESSSSSSDSSSEESDDESAIKASGMIDSDDEKKKELFFPDSCISHIRS